VSKGGKSIGDRTPAAGKSPTARGRTPATPAKPARSAGGDGASARKPQAPPPAPPVRADLAGAARHRAKSEPGHKAAAQATPIPRKPEPAPEFKGVPQATADHDQAVTSMRDLLEAKKARARSAPPWPHADPHQHRAHEAIDTHVPESIAQEHHAGEMRGRAIEGHIATQDRANQAKRDRRG
jgi:hypothetical protein